MIIIRRGLDLPIEGEPSQSTIDDAPPVTQVALVADDYVGMKPTLEVQEGDRVKLGQLLFTDKKTEGVKYTSPGCGTVSAVNRGAKRKFESLVIDLEGDDEEQFQSYSDTDLTTLSREQVCENLVTSGLWTAFRSRPYSKVPPPESMPHSIFVTAMDTNPLGVPADKIINEHDLLFTYGLQVLRHLTDGTIYVCKKPATDIPGSELTFTHFEDFAGPHPAGLPGTHIHFLDAVGLKKTVWHIGYQDVLAVGKLFTTGKLDTERVISLAGPSVENPRLLRTRLGANIDELVAGQLKDGNNRVISGSVLAGRQSVAPKNFLGRLHNQISALAEAGQREFLGWATPGMNQFSVKKIFASAFFAKGKALPLTTSTGGSRRAMVPVGSYEQVMPLDIMPTYLLRSLIVGDTEQAQNLGCLELDEEDIALCTYVCPGKYEYGDLLRKNLTTIEKEG